MRFFSRKSSSKGANDSSSGRSSSDSPSGNNLNPISSLSSSFSRLSAASSRSSAKDSKENKNYDKNVSNANNVNESSNTSSSSSSSAPRNSRKSSSDAHKSNKNKSSPPPPPSVPSHGSSRDRRPPVTVSRGSRSKGRTDNSTFTALPFSNTTFTTRLRSYTLRTLGSGTTLYAACKLPRGETCGAWVVVNLVDFLTDVSSIYDVVKPDVCTQQVGEGFPPGVEYKWSDSGVVRRVSGVEYCNLVLSWAISTLNDESLFPNEDDEELCNSIWNSKAFAKVVGSVFKRIFRVYAVIYTGFFEMLKEVDLSAELNSCFKHFMYFSFEFQLLQDAEVQVLDVLVKPIREQHKKAEFEHKRKMENKPGRY